MDVSAALNKILSSVKQSDDQPSQMCNRSLPFVLGILYTESRFSFDIAQR